MRDTEGSVLLVWHSRVSIRWQRGERYMWTYHRTPASYEDSPLVNLKDPSKGREIRRQQTLHEVWVKLGHINIQKTHDDDDAKWAFFLEYRQKICHTLASCSWNRALDFPRDRTEIKSTWKSIIQWPRHHHTTCTGIKTPRSWPKLI